MKTENHELPEELREEKRGILEQMLSEKKDIFDRDPKHFATDKACVEAIVQQCVNVELFTIPLYMTTLYSIQGMHQINSQGTAMYVGKLWPGAAPTFKPGSGHHGNIAENEKAFNTIFSVFIEEMLHLQLASNVATSLKIAPQFTQLSPKDKNYAWQCYSGTAIPGIVDFKDCEPRSGGIEYEGLQVKLDELNYRQNDLFLAIEAPEEECKLRIRKEEMKHYFPLAPFKDWAEGEKLPWFGSIGHMYQCLWDYLDIEYTDGTKLFDKMYSPTSLQQDLFNTVSPGHPYREFQQLTTTIEGFTAEFAKDVIFKLICAITDQGEGAGISKNIRPSNLLQRVQPVNQANYEALKADYPSFTDEGKPAPSSHAYARAGGGESAGHHSFDNGSHDHYERFLEIRKDIDSKKIVTWPTWHQQRGKNAWKPEDLKTTGYNEDNKNLPTAAEIAGALNRINNPDNDQDGKKRDANYKQFCEIATGAIAGITTVLDQFWTNSAVAFPFPSMGGSGDRLMMCWAVFGQLPNLATPIQPRQKDKLYHACQGLDLNTENPDDPNICASPEVYHNCRGSNTCKAEGGCGFVQLVGQSKSCGGSSSCGPSMTASKSGANLCGTPKPSNCGAPTPKAAPFSAPGDNLCGSFGGCAVPISASQIYPKFSDANGNPITHSTMELNDFPAPDFKIKKLDGDVPFATGDFVYDIAWDAYTKVIESRTQDVVPTKPKPSDIRIAFPPST